MLAMLALTTAPWLALTAGGPTTVTLMLAAQPLESLTVKT